MTKKPLVQIISGILTGFFFLSMTPRIHAGDMNAGIILADDQGRVLYAQNQDKTFVPASTLKILTSLAAIHILGEDYHFPRIMIMTQRQKICISKAMGTRY